MKKLPIVRPVSKGFFNEWLNDKDKKPEQFEGGVGFTDPRQHDWSVWQGPECRRPKRRIGFF